MPNAYLTGWVSDRHLGGRRAPAICALLVLLGVLTVTYGRMVHVGTAARAEGPIFRGAGLLADGTGGGGHRTSSRSRGQSVLVSMTNRAPIRDARVSA